MTQVISKLGVPSQSLVLLSRSGPSNDGWGQGLPSRPGGGTQTDGQAFWGWRFTSYQAGRGGQAETPHLPQT